MDALYQNVLTLIHALEGCLEKRQLLPCLALLYTGIDVMSSLERQPDEGTGAAFVRWVDDYLLTKHPLPCTSLELYAARCGILHTFSADSNLSRAGRARRLAYAWGTADARNLQTTARILQRDDIVAVHIHNLIGGFRDALKEYFDELQLDPDRQAIVQRQATLWFVHLDKEIVSDFLKNHSDEHAT